MKIKLQVAQHRKDHDGSVIVRLHQVESESAPVQLHQVIELHARSEEAVAFLRAPTDEKHEVFVNGTYRDAYGHERDKYDRKVITPVVPGAVIEVELTAVG